MDVYSNNCSEHINELCGEKSKSSISDVVVHMNTTKFQNYEYYEEVGKGCGDWMELVQDRDRWRALVSTVMNFRVP